MSNAIFMAQVPLFKSNNFIVLASEQTLTTDF